MQFTIKYKTHDNLLAIWTVFNSPIINDENDSDCILFLDTKKLKCIGINEIDIRNYSKMVENNTIVINNSTSIVALEFIIECLNSSFNPIGNDCFELVYNPD